MNSISIANQAGHDVFRVRDFERVLKRRYSGAPVLVELIEVGCRALPPASTL